MFRTACTFLCAALILVAAALPAHAAGSPSGPKAPNWSQRDTAVYVVSTLNLVRVHHRSLSSKLAALGVTQYDVYADLDVRDQYYVDLKRDDGTVLGSLAYRMGWIKPKSVSPFTDKLGVGKAPGSVLNDFKKDDKELIGSFTSTLPE